MEKKPTEKQLRVLDQIGSTAKPTTRAEAQAIITRHYRPDDGLRPKQKPIGRRPGEPKRRPPCAGGRYWLTPKVWSRACSHCGAQHSIAFRLVPRTYACGACVERLGIKAKESKAWREGGAQDPTVTIRHVDPATLRPDRAGAQNR